MARTWPALFVGLLIALIPATTHAAVYCVAEPSCPGGTDIGSTGSALITALSTAMGTSVPDEIDVGPGTFSNAGGFSYSTGNASNTLTLKGSGIGATTIESSTTGASLFVSSSGSQVSDLTVRLGPNSSTTGLSLNGSGAQALRVAAVGQAGTNFSTGVTLGTGTTLSGASVTSTGTQMTWGITGPGTVLDSSVDAGSATYGIYGPTDIHRVTIRAGVCIYANGSASYKVDNALLFPYAGSQGLTAGNTASTDTVTTADHVTVVGPGDASSVGFSAQATAGGSPHNATLILRSSIARGTGHSLRVWATNGAANIHVDHSDYDPATISSIISGSGSSGAVTDEGGNLNVDPLFVGASDYHLQASSPVIDAGATAVQSGESATDVDGAARAVDGNGDGTVATDMGAYEYQPPAPPSLGGSPPPTGAASHSVALKLASRRVAVDRRGRGKLGVRCTATGTTCRVSGRLVALVTKSSKRRSVTVGRVSGSGRAGGKATLAVRLNARGRRALAHRYKLRVRLVATVRGSDGASTALNASLSVVPKSKRVRA